MYNPDIIRELMTRKSVSAPAVLKAIGSQPRRSLTHLLYRNIGVERLEALASIFEVPVDTFFLKEGETVKSKVDAALFHSQIATNPQFVTDLLNEKDKRIELLESVVDDLRQQINDLKSGTPQGQNPEK